MSTGRIVTGTTCFTSRIFGGIDLTEMARGAVASSTSNRRPKLRHLELLSSLRSRLSLREASLLDGNGNDVGFPDVVRRHPLGEHLERFKVVCVDPDIRESAHNAPLSVLTVNRDAGIPLKPAIQTSYISKEGSL